MLLKDVYILVLRIFKWNFIVNIDLKIWLYIWVLKMSNYLSIFGWLDQVCQGKSSKCFGSGQNNVKDSKVLNFCERCNLLLLFLVVEEGIFR